MQVLIRKESRVPIKAWVDGVEFERGAQEQLFNIATMPFIFKHVAVMPDVHWGRGATIGSVIATKKAIIPSAIGSDIGCGMIAAKTNLVASDLPDNLHAVRTAIEKAVPHGRTDHGGPNDKGAWGWDSPREIGERWALLEPEFKAICEKHPKIRNSNSRRHLGSLGTGNHFEEICLDEHQNVWIMLHSGSRGIGSVIGSYFVELAKKDMERFFIHLPDQDLAYLVEGTEHFDDYFQGLNWAQKFAWENRQLILSFIVGALEESLQRPISIADEVVNSHHNYVTMENHFGSNVFVTRKGAVRARLGEKGIIPGSMGAKSFIVAGKGNPESFMSCSHGAGRKMSRTQAKRRYSLEDHITATEGVECRKDMDVIDETPMAYKSIDAVMNAQADLIDIVHTLHQVVCVKG